MKRVALNFLPMAQQATARSPAWLGWAAVAASAGLLWQAAHLHHQRQVQAQALLAKSKTATPAPAAESRPPLPFERDAWRWHAVAAFPYDALLTQLERAKPQDGRYLNVELDALAARGRFEIELTGLVGLAPYVARLCGQQPASAAVKASHAASAASAPQAQTQRACNWQLKSARVDAATQAVVASFEFLGP